MFTREQAESYKKSLVRFHRNNRPIGGGFHIQAGYILTCAHVVLQALGTKGVQNTSASAVKILEQERKEKGESIEIDFPFVDRSNLKKLEIIAALWRIGDEDIAVLKIEKTVPENIASAPILSSEYYLDHKFRTYGFPDGHPNGIWTRGEFLGELSVGQIQMEDTKAQGIAIEPGFSGSPVWDEDLGTIAGMTVSRDKKREIAKIGFMIPYQQLKLALDAIALFDLLLPEEKNLSSYWLDAYNFVRSKTAPLAPPKNLSEAILQIENISHGSDGYRASEKFIAYLAVQEVKEHLHGKLVNWLSLQARSREEPDRVGSLLNLARQELARQESEKDVVKNTVATSAHLMFFIQEENGQFTIKADFIEDRDLYDFEFGTGSECLQAPILMLEQSGDERVDRSKVKEILRACLDECGKKKRDLTTLRVEFFVPLHHVNWDVDRWPVIDEPDADLIGCRYQIVVRVTERWTYYSQYLGDWDRKWKLLECQRNDIACQSFYSGDNKRHKKLREELRKDKIVALQLNKPLVISDEDYSSTPLRAMLESGLPVAIWPRQEVSGVDFEFEFEKLTDCCLSTLPDTIKNLRKYADVELDEKDPHIGRHIGFIWEDPQLVPPYSRLKMPE